MEIKSKQERVLPMLCGMLILLACCFRSAAILRESTPLHSGGEIESFVYVTKGEMEASENAPLWETVTPELSLVQIDDRSGVTFDKEALFHKEITVAITDSPCVLIIHTHGTEAYEDQEGYRSNDPNKNVIRVGKEIADRLNGAGIPTIHDTTAHDMTCGYDAAYEQAAAAIEAYLDKYPSIQVVIDVHRDAASDGQGGQKAISAEIAGESAAGLLLVMGTDTTELPHKNWEENLAFAMQLQAYLSGNAPGLMRPTSLRAARYNEHFTSCSVLLEVGAAGNTMEEALCSARYFGDCLGELLKSLG